MTAQELKAGQWFRLPGKRKFRWIKEIKELSAANTDLVLLHGKLLLVCYGGELWTLDKDESVQIAKENQAMTLNSFRP